MIGTMLHNISTMPPALQAITRSARLKHFPKGQIIIYQGDELLDVYILKSGVVKLYDIDEQGNEKVLHLTKSPAVIPFAYFSGGKTPPHWFYAALTDCELYVVTYDTLLQAMNRDPALSATLTNHFSQDVHELLVRLSSLGKTKAHDKLIATLWFLARWHAEARAGSWRRVTFPVNHQLLADITGITRERAAVVMKELQDRKVVRSPRLTMLEISTENLHREHHPEV